MKLLKKEAEQIGNFIHLSQDVAGRLFLRILRVVLLICGGLLVSSCVLAESLDRIPGPTKIAYAIEYGSGFSGLYDNPDVACAVIAERMNKNTTVKTRYTNPRGGNKPPFGFGCFFDIIDPPGSQVGTVYKDWFGQNWIIRKGLCPEGYSLITRYGGSPSYRYTECSRHPSAPPSPWNQPNCGVGNPVIPSNGMKVQMESDYRPTFSDSIRFDRVYRSSASWGSNAIGYKPLIGRLGRQWYDTYQRTINYTNNGNTSSLVLASAFRPDGRIILFSLAEGEWQPKADISDTLAEQKDASGHRTGWKYTVAKNGSVENYNTLGMLTSITFRSGRQVVLEYANVSAPAKNQLISVTDSFGRQLHFGYDSLGRISTLTDPTGEIYTYAYDYNSNLISITYPDNTPADDSDNDKRIYHYEDPRFQNALTGISNSNGERFSTYAYDSQGRAILTEHADGVERVELTYNSDGSTTVTDAIGKIQTYHFSIINSVYKTKKIDGGLCTVCGNQSQSTAYDANGNISSKTDFNGNVSHYIYDLNRNIEISRTEAVGTSLERTTTIKWHVDFHLPVEIDIFDKVGNHLKNTSLIYDDRGLMLSRTETDIAISTSRRTTQSYNELGLLISVNGPRTEVDDITVYSYNAQGDLIKTSNALNQETLITSHDAQGRPLILQTPNGLITELGYDARGRIISRTIDGQTTLFSYDSESNLISLSLPNGAILSYTYDAAHRMIGISDSLGNTITYTLDALGNHTKEEITDPVGMLTRTQSHIYNTFNQLIKTIGGESQETDYGYDANGNLISRTDGLNQKTVWAFDALNRLVATTDAASGMTSYLYDALDHLVQLTAPNNLTTNYTYNALGDLLQLDSPSTSISSYTYDSAGNRLSQTDARSISTTYTYDALNRLTHIGYPDSRLNVTYTYDENENTQNDIGRLTSMSDASGTTEYRYDKRGNLIRGNSNREGVEYSTLYTYTPTDQISQITYPSGLAVNYFYNIAGQVEKVTATDVQGNTQTLANNALYQPFGSIIELEYGNGLSSLHSFDQDSRHTQITVNSVFDRNYTYDAADNISEIINNLDNNKDQTYRYDSLDRLINAQTNSSTLSFLYDGLGNRTQASSDSSTETYHYSSDSQHLTDINGNKHFSYDASGNTVQLPHATIFSDLSYGDHNRLTQVNGVSYIYNGNGERVKKQLSNGTAIHYHYDLIGQLIAETDDSGNSLTEYIYLNRQLIAMTVNANKDNTDTIEILLDNTDASYSDSWTTSTSVSGYQGNNYQYHPGNAVGPGVIGNPIDNQHASFTGTWSNSTSVKQFYQGNYQYHAGSSATLGVLGDPVDNQQASFTGTWPNSTSVKQYYLGNYQYHSPGTGANTANWTTGVSQLGSYDIYVNWTAHANRASNAKFTVHHVNGSNTITVNQKENGGQWNLLGTYTLDANSTITLSDDANGYVIADAISVLPAGTAPTVTQQQDESATWALNPTTPSKYDVYANWTAHENRASNAKYTIHHANGSNITTVNQQQNGGQWNLLGTFYLDASSKVELGSIANGYVIADAISILPEGTPPNIIPSGETATWTPNQTGTFEIYAKWTAHANRASDAKYTINDINGSDIISVNQKQKGGQWNLLGTFVLDSSSKISLNSAANGYVIADGLRLVGHSPASTTSGSYFVHPDHLGTPQVITDKNQTIVWQANYDPFGKARITTETITNNIRFPGQYYDSETQLHYNYYRYYDPQTGRYITSDPIGLTGGVNTYAYVDGKPLNHIDSKGLRASYCQRPLGDYSGKNGGGIALFNHQFICVTLLDGSVKCDSTNNPDNDTNPTTPTDGVPSHPARDNEETAQCENIDDDKDRCFESCILQEWSNKRPKYAIGALGTDCQEYSNNLVFKCKLQCKKKSSRGRR